MTETRQTCLFALLILTLVCAAGALGVGFKTYDQYHTDNQTITALRAQVKDLTQDLQDTEVTLDKLALEGMTLGEDNEVLRARAESAEKRAHL